MWEKAETEVDRLRAGSTKNAVASLASQRPEMAHSLASFEKFELVKTAIGTQMS